MRKPSWREIAMVIALFSSREMWSASILNKLSGRRIK